MRDLVPGDFNASDAHEPVMMRQFDGIELPGRHSSLGA